MDFIERIFGVSLDGGNGVVEICLMLILGAAIVAGGCWRYASRRLASKAGSPR